jgi:ankyrin repeat protein
MLLDRGADVNIQGGNFGNALQAAVSGRIIQNGHERVIQILLDHGIDANARSGKNHGSALQEAAAYGNEKIVQILLDHGADVTDEALKKAADKGHEKVSQMLQGRRSRL